MSASAAVWNGRFGAFGIVSVILGSLRRWRKVWQRRHGKSNLAPRGWWGAVWGARGRRWRSVWSGSYSRSPDHPQRPECSRRIATGAPAPCRPSRALRPTRGFSWERGSEVEGLQVGAELVGEVGPGERELDGRLEESELVARVVAPALELDGVHGAARRERAQGVGQLDLPASIGPCPRQDLENLGRQDIPSDDGQVGRRVLGFGLLDEVEDLVHARSDRPGGDHPVLMDARARNALDREHRRLVPLAHVEQLPHAR